MLLLYPELPEFRAAALLLAVTNAWARKSTSWCADPVISYGLISSMLVSFGVIPVKQIALVRALHSISEIRIHLKVCSTNIRRRKKNKNCNVSKSCDALWAHNDRVWHFQAKPYCCNRPEAAAPAWRKNIKSNSLEWPCSFFLFGRRLTWHKDLVVSVVCSQTGQLQVFSSSQRSDDVYVLKCIAVHSVQPIGLAGPAVCEAQQCRIRLKHIFLCMDWKVFQLQTAFSRIQLNKKCLRHILQLDIFLKHFKLKSLYDSKQPICLSKLSLCCSK